KLFDRSYQTVVGAVMKIIPAYKQELIVGEGCMEQAPWLLRENNCVRPMIVTGPRVGQSDFFQRLRRMIPEGIVFDQVEPDPTTELVGRIMDLYLEKDCDSFVAIGGGSDIDAAKAAAAGLARQEKKLTQLGGVLKVREMIPFFIAIPTTAGTGSETTSSAVITDSETGRKFTIGDPMLCPYAVILDPALTESLPKEMVAASGMDALTHAVEAYFNWRYHKRKTPKLCLAAIHDVMLYLPFVYEDNTSVAARQKLLLASYRAGQAFNTACVGNVHAIAHAIGGMYHLPHGYVNAVVLPAVLEDYGKKVTRPLADMGRISGCKGNSREELASAFIDRIRELNREMDIPETIPQIRVGDMDQMADWAVREANPLYPVPIIYSRDDVKRVLTAVSDLH
ncbi:MAG: iron-containing alcohol dehydrogenase, partial [Bacillota bacterium]|nr:iron-containing alcohol dehydrogenase [Bacillota bacterium]